MNFPLLTNIKATIFVYSLIIIPNFMFYFAKLSYFCFEFVKAYFKHYLGKSIDHTYFAAHNCTAAFSIIVTDSKARV